METKPHILRYRVLRRWGFISQKEGEYEIDFKCNRTRRLSENSLFTSKGTENIFRYTQV